MTPDLIAAVAAEAWCDAFEASFQTQAQSRIAELEYSDEVAAEARRYLNELILYLAQLGPYGPLTPRTPPTTTLHPNYQALVQEAAQAQVERWRASQARLAPYSAKPVPPVALDRANPRQLDLDRCRLLNYNPAQYLGRPVSWPAPVTFNAARFMHKMGLPELASYTELLRLTTDGRVQVRAASGLWFRLIGVAYDFAKPAPMQIVNTVRPQQVQNPQLLQFLELLT